MAFNAIVQTRMNFATQHLLAASRFSKTVYDVEQANHGAQFGDFYNEILHNASACILSAGASLEAYPNEIFADKAKLFPDHSTKLLEKFWSTFERKPSIDKFQMVLFLRDKPELAPGSDTLRNVRTLIELRNALTHFKPEWSGEAARHVQISRTLDGKFSPSPFLNDSNVFPRRWATAGCTRWAIKACLEFASLFEVAADLPSKYRPDVYSYDGVS
ncbi:hypothetical protein AB8B02_05790 [Tardiphaga sp. 862_B3_N4_1]|uniref:hypothetical protein n=1 Tax=Tardiphaga sp. 862_B3_N4_1 TaxID=3240764 RepID=UPI003F20DB07